MSKNKEKGKVVAVWSSAKKAGKTVAIYNLIPKIKSLLHKEAKILVVCLNLTYGNLLKMCDVNDTELSFEEVINHKIHTSQEVNWCNALANKENIYYLASNRASIDFAKKNIKLYEKLLEEFRENFDLTIIDTIAGNDNFLTNMVLDKSNHIININTQDIEILDRCKLWEKPSTKVTHVINFYRDIYPKERDVESLYRLDKVYTLPMCNELQEMKNKQKYEQYTHHETEYNKDISELAKHLVELLKLPVLEVEQEKKKWWPWSRRT